jgi:hypothetical protein
MDAGVAHAISGRRRTADEGWIGDSYTIAKVCAARTDSVVEHVPTVELGGGVPDRAGPETVLRCEAVPSGSR